STANDIALFFEKLYRGEIGNQETNQEMINLLKQQKLKNKVPKYLPKETVVAHKTGELGLFTHDAGIVFGRKTNYLITILSESNSPIGAEERIAKVSQAVYDYFEN
ncbi:serine hydrolase, partial [Candidatus Microgenomates bacterium]|nr:serine hydrolase [Candidatus Microgenomates bacterium]